MNHPLSVFVRKDLKWDDRGEAIALGSLLHPELPYSPNKEALREILVSAADEGLLEVFRSPDRVREFRDRLVQGRR